MWVKAATSLSERVWQVTTPVSSHIFLAGADAALVDSGIASFASELESALRPLVEGEVGLKFLLLTHTHFDHVGGIPHLRKAFPGIEVIGSPESAKFLGKESYLRELYRQNEEAAAAMKREMEMPFEEWAAGLKIDRIQSEGDTVNLGDGIDVKVVGCPGHTIDSIGFYQRFDCALAAGEAVGSYHGRDRAVPCFLSSFDDYVQTLDKLAGLDVKVLSLSHTGALTGDLAKKHLIEGRLVAERLRDNIKERFAVGELTEGIVTELFSDWGIEGFAADGPFLPSQREAIAKMVKVVAEDLKGVK